LIKIIDQLLIILSKNLSIKMSSIHSKILVHLHRPPLPTDGGDKQRLMGMLNYFRDRQNSLLIDGFGGNIPGRVEWRVQDVCLLQPYVKNFQYYQGEHNLLDFVYSRSQSFYYQKILGQQLPIDTDYFAPPNYVQFVKKLVKQGKYDYIWLNYLESAALAVDLKKNFNLKIFIDIHDLACQGRLVINDFEYLQKLKFDYQKNLIKEANLLNKFDRVIVNSQQEIDILSSYIAADKLVLIPHLLEASPELKNITPYSQREFKYDLLFVGTGRSPNLNGINFFLQEIFPQIVREKPDVTLALVGSINQVIKIPQQLSKNIISLGYVANLSTIYLHSKVNICPLLKGAGTKVKLQEALAYALPIVTTTVGASGLRLKNHVNAYIADEPPVFAAEILALLNDQRLCQKFSTAASLIYQEYYAQEQVYLKLDRLFGITSSLTNLT
jgi:glycosyltransferase involved in cell wall biosynthesis